MKTSPSSKIYFSIVKKLIGIYILTIVISSLLVLLLQSIYIAMFKGIFLPITLISICAISIILSVAAFYVFYKDKSAIDIINKVDQDLNSKEQ